MVGLHTSMETISLEVNDGSDWREGEVGKVRPIQKDESEGGKTVKIREGHIPGTWEKQRLRPEIPVIGLTGPNHESLHDKLIEQVSANICIVEFTSVSSSAVYKPSRSLNQCPPWLSV